MSWVCTLKVRFTEFLDGLWVRTPTIIPLMDQQQFYSHTCFHFFCFAASMPLADVQYKVSSLWFCFGGFYSTLKGMNSQSELWGLLRVTAATILIYDSTNTMLVYLTFCDNNIPFKICVFFKLT